MTEEEFRRHRDGEGSPEEAREFFHMFMNKACGASAKESDDLLHEYVNVMSKAHMLDEDNSEPEPIPEPIPEPKQEEKIILKESEYEVL